MLAAEISDQVFPSIARLKVAVAAQRRFAISNSGINEDGEAIGVIGLRCEEEPSMCKPALSFTIAVTRNNAGAPKTARGSVTWSIPWVRDKQEGLMAYEAQTKPIRFHGPRLPEEVISALPHLERAFVRALNRGQPPGALLSLWRNLVSGTPKPQVLRLQIQPNKAPEPTPTSGTVAAQPLGVPAAVVAHL